MGMAYEMRLYTDEEATLTSAVKVDYTVQSGECLVHPVDDQHATLVARALPGLSVILVARTVGDATLHDVMYVEVHERDAGQLGIVMGDCVPKQAHRERHTAQAKRTTRE